MTSTTSTRRPALAMITATSGKRSAPAAARRRPRPASPAHRALEARLVGCFG